MPRVSLPFLSTGLWTATNSPSGKRCCFPRQWGREAAGGEVPRSASHRKSAAQPRPRAPIAAGPAPGRRGEEKILTRRKQRDTRFDTLPHCHTKDIWGYPTAASHCVPPGTMLNTSWQGGWDELPALPPFLPPRAPHQWSWCPTMKLQPAHDVCTMSDWEILTEIHCSWTRDSKVSSSPILVLPLISQLTLLLWSIHQSWKGSRTSWHLGHASACAFGTVLSEHCSHDNRMFYLLLQVTVFFYGFL